MRKRIYIAGPMSGYAEFNYPEFIRVGAAFVRRPELRKEWIAVSPAEIGLWFGATTEFAGDAARLRRLMDVELAVVKSCDAILLLRGWEKSAGARGELAVALANNLEVYTQESGVFDL